jgi:hypothetical protein
MDELDSLIKEYKNEYDVPDNYEEELKELFPTYKIENISHITNRLMLINELINNNGLNVIKYIIRNNNNGEIFNIIDNSKQSLPIGYKKAKSILGFFVNGNHYCHTRIDGAKFKLKHKLENVGCCVCFEGCFDNLMCNKCGNIICGDCVDLLIDKQMSEQKQIKSKCKKHKQSKDNHKNKYSREHNEVKIINKNKKIQECPVCSGNSFAVFLNHDL